ncbi:MAG: hypothetical protein M5U11_11140 [Anaerolineales bacterium]|nr:hypothetical protein [Anaerolineales bacterium]
MDITTFTQSLQTAQTDAVLVDVTEDASALTGAAGALDQALGGALRDLLQTGDFAGKPNETALLYTRGAIPAPRVIAVGLGKADEVTPDRIRQAAAAGMKKARELGCRTAAASLFGAETGARRRGPRGAVADRGRAARPLPLARQPHRTRGARRP